jgi:cysteine-rich repeat protein
LLRSVAELSLLLCLPAFALAADHTVSGEVTTPYPTLENLSIEWAITGDDDADGTVTVRFRQQGTTAWRDGLPLRRVPAGSNEGFSWTNKHAGSLFDLVPGTTYEIELKLDDPDGGSETRSMTASTRNVPGPAPGARVKSAAPSTFAQVTDGAAPGDVIELAAGTYPGFEFSKSGTSTAPIVIRAAVVGAAVIAGDVRLDGQRFVIVDGLTIHGTVKFNDASDIAVTRCAITTTGSGVVAYGNVSNIYVADNVVLGPTTFSDATVGADGANVGEGIELTGAGNVIAYNRVKGFRDCISTLEDEEATNQVSIDIYNNDIEVGADDAIEADFTMGNTRILRNRIVNSFVGISAQPTLGGPAYHVRNVMFNVIYSPFKLHRGGSGDVALHNTVVKSGDALAVYASVPWSRAFFRNNLFLGGQGGGTYGGYENGDGRIAQLAAADATCSFDHDGFGSIGTGTFQGRIGSSTFASLAELRSRTTEQHAVQVDMSVFAQPIAFPAAGPFPELAAPDLRLATGSPAVDAGLPLDNVNTGYAGSAPDLGAHELGSAQPHYGPRTHGVVPVCGNGAREGAEECDDGNTIAGDGCSAACAVEQSITGSVAGGPGSSSSGCGHGTTTHSTRSWPFSLLLLAGAMLRHRPRRCAHPTRAQLRGGSSA